MVRETLSTIWSSLVLLAYGLLYIAMMLLGFVLVFTIPWAIFKLLDWGQQAFPEWGWLFLCGKVIVALAILFAVASLNPETPEDNGDGQQNHAPQTGSWGASKAKWYVANWGKKW